MEQVKEQQIEVTIEDHSYMFEKSEKQWQLALRKSEVQVSEVKDLAIIKVKRPYLMDTAIHWEEDTVTFMYQLPHERITFAELEGYAETEKLRAMINMAGIVELMELPLTFFIHPENLIFDYNLIPQIAYRGLSGKMPPKSTTNDLLLRQYKSLIIALFDKKADFSALYGGQLEIKKGSEFCQTIQKKESFVEIKEYLNQVYHQTIEQNKKTTKIVNKAKYQVTKQIAIWMSILAVVLVIPLVYLFFFRIPFLDRMQEADTAFLKVDYEQVISDLEPVSVKKIPFTQKYELAYSFIQGEALQEQQKKVILTKVSLRSEEKYLDYWIENGRGNLDEALDVAKNLEDSDLIIYALTQKIEQVRKEPNLTGAEKEEQINKLEDDYKKYKEKREETSQSDEGTDQTQASSVQEGN